MALFKFDAMKHLLYIIMFCYPLGYGQGVDYIIARKALNHFPGYEKYRVINIPYNEYIENYFSGFYSGEVYGQETNDYVIASKVLEHLDHLKQFTILSTPNNFIISNYLDGFEIKGIAILKNAKFKFNINAVYAWEDNEVLLVKAVSDKINIIKEELRKTFDPQQARTYLSLSNPAFSEDGKYAIININFLCNYPLSTPESLIYIFAWENDDWIYKTEFTGILY